MEIGHYKLVESWIGDLEKLRDSRNQVVHSAWMPFNGLKEYERSLTRKIANGTKELQRERMTKIELEKINLDIIDLHSEGWEVFHKIFPFKVTAGYGK